MDPERIAFQVIPSERTGGWILKLEGEESAIGYFKTEQAAREFGGFLFQEWERAPQPSTHA